MAVAASAPGSLWICAALSDVDRDVAATAVDGRIDVAGHDTGGAAVRMLAVDPDVLAGAYTSIANGTLWPVNHGLGDTPAFDDEWRADWERYVAYNQQFAEAIADEAATGAKVLVQDYHLNLVPAALRRVRPDLRIGHFTHTPWATPEDYAQLPRDVGRAIVDGLLGADSLGFHSPRWAEDFAGCARDAGASVDVPLRVHPLGVDPAPLIERASQPDVAERVSALRAVAGDRKVIARVDRTEPAKNIHRGLLAFAELLRSHPEHLGQVVHVALAYPSRQDVAEYRDYTADCVALAEEINEEYDAAERPPVVFEVRDDYADSLATLSSADVLLVNSLRDGMNLVAKEGVILSAHAALVLSRETGAADEMTEALLVDPLDVDATAAALHAALTMTDADRSARHDRLAASAAALPPQAWLQQQLDVLSEGI